MSSLRDKVKSAGYTLGPLGLYHVLLNRSRLTAVMFHRVLPGNAPERRGCDPDYVLDADIFEQCLGFFARHYNVVSLDQVVGATRGGALPSWPLLITFDDGWMDTFTRAAPMLAARGLPGACFVVSDALGEIQWWQNGYAVAWQAGRATLEQIEAVWTGLALPPPAAVANPYLRGLAMLADLPGESRRTLMSGWLSGIDVDAGQQMMEAADLPCLINRGVAVGAHGASHVPMTLSRDPHGELCSARAKLQRYVGGVPREIDALSFPHGRFDPATVAAARACGYALMFTSTPHLSELSNGQLESDVCGRIEIATRHVAPEGTFRPDLLACHLFLRHTVKTPGEALAAGMAFLQ